MLRQTQEQELYQFIKLHRMFSTIQTMQQTYFL
ncbi:UNVERIFIED_CONTAM: hypothetical protein GTU68_066222 [Idotea baltica]|nr:hypothetical protein [Idotea baltica]